MPVSSFYTFLEELQYAARMLRPGTCTQVYYLGMIKNLRRITGNHSVILDADNCIVVL